MLLIVIATIIVLFLIASFLPIWCIKWKYADPSKATVDLSGNCENIPDHWMCSDDRDLPLWTLLFGTLETAKTMQSYSYIYNIGNNIKWKIGLFPGSK